MGDDPFGVGCSRLCLGLVGSGGYSGDLCLVHGCGGVALSGLGLVGARNPGRCPGLGLWDAVGVGEGWGVGVGTRGGLSE